MKYVKYVNTNTIKHGETGTQMSFRLYDGDAEVQEIKGKIIANVANMQQEFLTSVVPTINGNRLTLDFSSDELKVLNAGDYLLEFTVFENDKVVKYPTRGGVKVVINSDLTTNTGELIPSQNLDELFKRLLADTNNQDVKAEFANLQQQIEKLNTDKKYDELKTEIEKLKVNDGVKEELENLKNIYLSKDELKTVNESIKTNAEHIKALQDMLDNNHGVSVEELAELKKQIDALKGINNADELLTKVTDIESKIKSNEQQLVKKFEYINTIGTMLQTKANTNKESIDTFKTKVNEDIANLQRTLESIKGLDGINFDEIKTTIDKLSNTKNTDELVTKPTDITQFVERVKPFFDMEFMRQPRESNVTLKYIYDMLADLIYEPAWKEKIESLQDKIDELPNSDLDSESIAEIKTKLDEIENKFIIDGRSYTFAEIAQEVQRQNTFLDNFDRQIRNFESRINKLEQNK